jgi:hypothetical protein
MAISSITYVMLVAGVKNHHLKSISTPQLFFAQMVFCGQQPFSAALQRFTSPTSCSATLQATQSSPKH